MLIEELETNNVRMIVTALRKRSAFMRIFSAFLTIGTVALSPRPVATYPIPYVSLPLTKILNPGDSSESSTTPSGLTSTYFLFPRWVARQGPASLGIKGQYYQGNQSEETGL